MRTLKISLFFLLFFLQSISADGGRARPYTETLRPALVIEEEQAETESEEVSSDVREEVSTDNSIVLDNEVDDSFVVDHAFKELLGKLDVALENGHLTAARDYILEIEKGVYEKQKDDLDSLFPEVIASFNLQSNRSAVTDISSLDFGFSYRKLYENGQGGVIDMNIIHDDPAILEYTDLVKNPNLVSGLDKLSVVTIQGYNALKKDSEDKTTFELNIVLSSRLLISVYSNDVSPFEEVGTFLQNIPFDKIQLYLEN